MEAEVSGERLLGAEPLVLLAALPARMKRRKRDMPAVIMKMAHLSWSRSESRSVSFIVAYRAHFLT